jgi:hypothetical protein
LRHFEDGERVLDSRLQRRFLECSYPAPFYYLMQSQLVIWLSTGFCNERLTELKAVEKLHNKPQAACWTLLSGLKLVRQSLYIIDAKAKVKLQYSGAANTA